MTPESLRRILEAVASGELAAGDALAALRLLPADEIPDATLDTHRTLRCGFPEVIFAERKTPAQILAIAERIVAGGNRSWPPASSPRGPGRSASAFPAASTPGRPASSIFPAPTRFPPRAWWR